MDSMTLGILIVAGVLAVAFFVWVEVASWKANHRKPAKDGDTPKLCDPETCEHEWQFWDDETECITDYSSYGGPDTFGTVVSHHAFCPKCGTHEVTDEVRGD